MDTALDGRPIARGYPYKLKITVTGTGDEVIFPVGCALEAQFRETVDAPYALATASTANGKLTRVDDDTVLLSLDRDDTKNMDGRVVGDIVRVDLLPDEWLGIQLDIPVETAVTLTGLAG